MQVHMYAYFLENVVKQDPVLQNEQRWAFQSRQERVETGLRKHMYLDKIQADLGITDIKEREHLRA